MRRALRRLEFVTLPSWVCVPLLVFGGMYLLAQPLGVAGGWAYYIWTLTVAGTSSVLFSWRYRVSVVERSEDSVLVRCELRRSSHARNPHALD